MDDDTLHTLKVFTNFCYALGVCSCKFVTTTSVNKNETEIQIEENRTSASGSNNIERDGGKSKKLFGLSFIHKQAEKRHLFTRVPLTESNWMFVDDSKGRYSYNYKWWLFLISMVFQCIYHPFLIFRSIQYYFNNEVLEGEENTAMNMKKIFMYYRTVNLMTAHVSNWVFFRHYHEFVPYLNAVRGTVAEILEIQEAMGQRSGRRKLKNSFRKFLYVLTSMCTMNVIIGIFDGILRPHHDYILTSLADDPLSLPAWVKLLVAIFNFMAVGFPVYIMNFLVVTLTWYVFCTIIALDILTLATSPSSSLSLPVIHELMSRFYSQLSVLQEHIATVFRMITLGIEIAIIQAMVTHIFLTVVHLRFVMFLRLVCEIFLAKTFFTKLAEVSTKSQELIDMWRKDPRFTRKTATCFQKYARSCRPLRVYVGNFFFIDQTFVLTLAVIIMEQSVSIILAFK